VTVVSPIRSPILSPVDAPLGEALIDTPKVIAAYDFGALNAGVGALPAGVSLARTSTATDIHPRLTPTKDDFAANQARIVNTLAGRRGLLLEGPTTNRLGALPWSLAGAASGGSSTTHDTATADVVGVTGAGNATALHAVLSGGYARYDAAVGGIGATEVGLPVCSGAYWQGAAGQSAHLVFYDGSITQSREIAVTPTWAHAYDVAYVSGTVRSLQLADGRTTNNGGTRSAVSAKARTVRSCFEQMEVGRLHPSSYVAPTTSRAGDRASVAAAGHVVDGRLCLEVSWELPCSLHDAPGHQRIWSHSSGDFAEVIHKARAIRLYLSGTYYWIGAPITGEGGELVVLRLDVGNGPTYGTVQVGAGRVAQILDGREMPAVSATGTITVGAKSDGAFALEGTHTRWRFFDRSPSIRVVEVSTESALRAACAAARGRTVVRARAGTYRLTDSLTMRGGALAPYPGESVSVSGGRLLTGAWSGPDVNGVYTLSVPDEVTVLWVGGTRAVRARGSGSGWTWVQGSSTITAPDPATAAKVGTTGRVHWIYYWRGGFVHVASVAGSDLTAEADTFADSCALGPSYCPNAVDYVEGPGFVGDAEGYWWWAGGVLSYKPRTGETMGSVEVIAGSLEAVITVEGTLDSPATDVSISGLTIEHSAWAEPFTSGANAITDVVLYRDSGTTYLEIPGGLVRVYAALRPSVVDCTLRHCDSSAVTLRHGTSEAAICNCTFADISASAVSIGTISGINDDPWPADARARLANNVVANNMIGTCGVVYSHAACVSEFYSTGSVRAYNEITGARWAAMTHGNGWGQLDIATVPGTPDADGTGAGWPTSAQQPPAGHGTYSGNLVNWRNKVVGFGLVHPDVGAFYGNSDASYGGLSLTAENYVDCTGAPATESQPYYEDEGRRGVIIARNVAESVTGTLAMKLQAGVLPTAKRIDVLAFYATAGAIQSTPQNIWSAFTVGALGANALAVKAAAGRG